MTTAERRAAILQQLAHAGAPLAARTLATHYGVSRQVIVQDLAVIRASHPGIISTARGYVLEQPDQPVGCTREFKVRHTPDRTGQELNLIVDCGGRVKNISSNHRTGLSDGVLLKDNHIGAAGGVAKAVKMARQYASFVRKIEVEVETLEQVKEAVEAGADIIMLDNMSDEDMRKAVTLIAGRAKTECSGNVTRENIARLRDIGIDYVSSGALTHSAPILDLSMKHLRPLAEEEA